MKRYAAEIRDIWNSLKRDDYRKIPTGSAEKRNSHEYPIFLKSGVATAALSLSKYGTLILYRHRKAVERIHSTEPVSPMDAIDKLVEVQKVLSKDGGTRTYRPKEGWTVPKDQWEDIFTSDGLSAFDQLIQTETLVIGKGEDQKEGTMFYYPSNGKYISAAARLICEELWRTTGDPVFNIRVSDRRFA